MGGSLLDPKGLLLLGLLAPLVVLYILKIKRKRLVVPSTWLWKSAERDLLAKAPFRKLIAQASLILQALAIILLALALSRPSIEGAELVGDHVAVVVDVSASMAAEGGEGAGSGDRATRLDRGKLVAKELVRALPPGAQVLVVEAGRDARIASPLDRDARRIESAIDALAVQEVEGDLAAAVALATDRLEGLDGARVIVVTDGYLARSSGLETARLPVEVLTVGDEVDNTAIVRTDVRSGIDPVSKREQVQAFLLVANYGRAAREVYVTMRQDNASDVLASRRLLLPAGERVPVVLDFAITPGDYEKGLVFDVSPHDALPVDDVAYGRVPAGDKLPVVLAAPEAAKASAWLERALASDPGVELRRLGVAELLASTGLDPGALVVVDGACPARPPGGDLLVVAPPPGECQGLRVGEELSAPLITSWEAADPRMRFLSLDGVGIARAQALLPESASQALVRAREGVLVADASTPSRQVTVVGFDVGQSDWPLKASFVLFVRNVIEQARAHRMSGIVGAGGTGEPLRVILPDSATEVRVNAPGEAPLELASRGGIVVVPNVARAGLYRFEWSGPAAGTLVVPVNLASEAESNLSKRTDLSAAPNVTARAASELPQRHRDLGFVAAALALALLLAEIWHHTKKPRAPKTSPLAEPRLPERRAAS